MTGNRVLWTTAIIAVAVLASITAPGLASAQPEVTESNVENGDVLDSAPTVFHMCFSEPVNTQDITGTQDDSGDEATPRPWSFNLAQPDGVTLGLRIVFEPGGDCVDVFPGLPDDPPEGVWTFDWLVESQASGEQASGLVTFRVGPGEPPDDQISGSTNNDRDIGTSLIIGIIAGVAAAVVVTGVVVVVGRRRRRAGSEQTGE
jgi:ABC-type dipeptide/oligopeptide/nickel transport system permease subunit